MNLKDKKGITIYMSLMILSSVIVIAFFISNLVIKTSQSNTKIKISEKAYYGADTAIQQALYAIETSRDILLTESSGQVGSGDVTWEREVEPVYEAVDCLELDQDTEGICFNEIDFDTGQKELRVHLDPDNSFQLELDFENMNNDGLDRKWFPDEIAIETDDSGDTFEIIIFDSLESTITTSTDFLINGDSLDDLQNKKYIIRLINRQSTILEFILTPENTDITDFVNIPVGFSLIATGNLQDQERKLEVERKNWQIY
jgi:hypothetical protein